MLLLSACVSMQTYDALENDYNQLNQRLSAEIGAQQVHITRLQGAIKIAVNSESLCCTDQQPGAVCPRSDIYVRRTYSGRPSSIIRFSEATAMATSVICRPLVRERSASPITRL